jgi:hypothetical protein
MAGKQVQDDKAPAVVAEPDDEVTEAAPMGSWEFIGDPPTSEQVKALLETLPTIWGIRQETFWEYVQPLSQSKNIATERGVKDFRVVWNLYFTVAGRVAMINQAAIINDWTVSFEPEPNATPPGFLEYGDRLVYREYCTIYRTTSDEELVLFGRRPGTAWVPGSGGSGAVATNRFEKVETSARGRSIAAWGFGVIPGSGIASFDEMLAARDNTAEPRPRGGQQAGPPMPRMSRGDMESALRQGIVEYSHLTGVSDDQAAQNTQDYAAKNFNRVLTIDPDTDAVDFGPLKDGEIALFLRFIQSQVTKKKAETGFEG